MLNFYAHFAGELGYTVLSRELLKALVAEKDEVTPVSYDMGQLSFEEKEWGAIFRRTPDMKSPSLCISYGSDMYKFHGKKRTGYTMWETTRFPVGWEEGLNQLDEVWTMSKWGKESFEKNGVTAPIYVVPGGVSPEFNPYAPPLEELRKLREDNFIFLSVFRWEYRKSPDMLIRAFHEAFPNNEKVQLLLLAFNPFMNIPINEWPLYQYKLMYEIGVKDDRIHFLPPVNERAWLPSLYTSAHSFVLPSKGEGFGLPYIEAMACGLPTIGTDFSGNTEFMTPDNSYLVEVDHMEAANMPPFIHPRDGSTWAVPSEEDLIRQMRLVFDKKEEAAKVGMKASEYVHTNFPWKKSAKIAWDRVNDQ